MDEGRRPRCVHVPQPQWEQFAVMRDCIYTHTQPQWSDVAAERGHQQPQRDAPVSASSASRAAWSPTVVRPPPLESRRVCTTCLHLKEECTCRSCAVCSSSFLKNRHHCRRCWHAVCSSCWGYQHYVHMLGRPMAVCDRCSVPWALASISKRDETGLLWGLYALRVAGEMPRECITPSCRTFTRKLVCYTCGMPTVQTQPHASRVVRADGLGIAAKDAVSVLDMQQLSLRSMEVNGMTTAHVEQIFRNLFHHYEEITAFRTVTTASAARKILLANVAAAVAYEYASAPNITLGMSDVPYARVLQVTASRERYTVLEAPGRVKYIAFPGTHNWRTRWVDVSFSRVRESVWTPLHEGVRAGPTPSSPPVALCGGVRRTWSYQVHGGFAQEAREVGLPLEELIEDVRSGGYTLVLCGHSLGGAIAQYLTLQLLHKAGALLAPSGPLAEPRLMCVAFGAPVLGNYELADHVQSCGWTHLFHNIVYRSDVVPRLSCTDELAWDAQDRLTRSLASIFTSAQNWWRGRRAREDGREDSDLQGEASRQHASSSPERTYAPRSPSPAAPAAAASVESSPSRNDGSPAQRGHGVRALLSKAVRKTAARTLGMTGGVSEGILIAEADRRDGNARESDDASLARSEAEEEEEARLAAYMDAAIRTSGDLLEEDDVDDDRAEEDSSDDAPGLLPPTVTHQYAASSTSATAMRRDADVEAALTRFSRRRQRTNVSNEGVDMQRPRQQQQQRQDGDGNGEGDRARQNGGSPPSASLPPPPPEVAADVLIPSRRVHRRFTCFGRYHFVQYGSYGYVSTADSETAFGILKHGCGEGAALLDHRVSAYNRGLMIHLYRNLD